MKKKIIYYLQLLLLKIWYKFNFSKGNVHLSFKEARLKKIPFKKNQIFIRPNFSDFLRIVELHKSIYFTNNYLNDRLIKKSPTVLLDLGANIGTSTLSMIDEYKFIKKVIGIEAEIDNFKVLEKNYQLWSKKYKNIEFVALHAVASSDDGVNYKLTKSLANQSNNMSASGTFIFNENNSNNLSHGVNSVSINSILDKFAKNEDTICKIDIEGGESKLFEKNYEWLKNVVFMTLEIHDRFSPDLFKSSKNVIKVLKEYDFAIIPNEDILFCYARKIN